MGTLAKIQHFVLSGQAVDEGDLPADRLALLHRAQPAAPAKYERTQVQDEQGALGSMPCAFDGCAELLAQGDSRLSRVAIANLWWQRMEVYGAAGE